MSKRSGRHLTWGPDQYQNVEKCHVHLYLVCFKNPFMGQAWWLTPVIPALWEDKAGGLLDIRSLRPAWLTWKNPVSTKNTKN